LYLKIRALDFETALDELDNTQIIINNQHCAQSVVALELRRNLVRRTGFARQPSTPSFRII